MNEVPECVFREIDLAMKALAELKPMTEYGRVGTRDVDQARWRTALIRAEGSLDYLRKLLGGGREPNLTGGGAAIHNDHPLRHYDRTCPACNPSVLPPMSEE